MRSLLFVLVSYRSTAALKIDWKLDREEVEGVFRAWDIGLIAKEISWQVEGDRQITSAHTNRRVALGVLERLDDRPSRDGHNFGTISGNLLKTRKSLKFRSIVLLIFTIESMNDCCIFMVIQLRQAPSPNSEPRKCLKALHI